MPKSDTYFTKDNAREMQARGTEVRKENTARRKAVAHVLSDMLSKQVTMKVDGKETKVTKLEWLVARAIDNCREDVALSDLLKIQELLGEKTVNNIVNITGGKSREDIIKMLDKDD
jgi:hypothetical protein